MKFTYRNVVGSRFHGPNGNFEVVEGKLYGETQITPTYRRYLLALRPKVIVGVFFYGTLTPLITVDSGVVRITKAIIGKKTYTGSRDISAALGIKAARDPCILRA